MSLQTQSAFLDKKIAKIDDEEIECFIERHWIALLEDMLLPLSFTVISIILFIYRALGGTFIVKSSLTQQFDTTNMVISVVGMGALVVVVLAKPKTRFIQQGLVGTAVLFGIITYLRYEGWRVFYVDTFAAATQRFDMVNIVAVGMTVAGILYNIYLYREWEDDYLILTNKRVITWRQLLFGQHSQSQIFIEDIQNVMAQTSTYIEHWLNYGTITITSASFGPKLVFQRAAAPRAMQGKIMGRVNATRQNEMRGNFDMMIKARIYNNAPPKELPNPKLSFTKSPPLVRLIFQENPVVEKNGTITWRPHWIFIPLVLLKPIGGLIATFAGVFFLHSVVPLGGAALTILTIIFILFFVAWAAYEIEDERNELYILKTNGLVDVEKKPFGPEKVNTTGLDKIQNVTQKTSFLGRLIGYGDVFVDTAGSGSQLTFPHLPNPSEVVRAINDYRNWFKKGEKERALNDSITLLKHYHNLEIQREQEEKTAAEQAQVSQVSTPEPQP